jgi:hypothetical protein
MPDSSEVRLAHLATTHNAAIDALMAQFEAELKAIVGKASARTLSVLQGRLALAGGVIDRSPANQRVMRSLDAIFSQEMDAAGYDKLVQAFVGKFGEQFRYFRDVLDIVAPGKTVTFSGDDKAFFSSLQLNAADSLGAVVDIAGALAQQKALFSVGGPKMTDLAELLSDRLQQTLPAAARLADTAITVFYRSVSERGFAVVEKGLPLAQLRYRYWGPDDKLTRPFCRHLVESGKTYSREEIDLMNNHQFPVGTVMLTCGGFRCRHSWLMAPLVPNPDPAASMALAA